MRSRIVLSVALALTLPAAALGQSQAPGPAASAAASAIPSAAASAAPSAASSQAPSAVPEPAPSAAPAATPNAAPSTAPSVAPSVPSTAPTAAPKPAAPRTPKPSAKAVRAARDATRKAEAITYHLVGASGPRGSVALYPIGRTRSRIVVTVPGGTTQRITLHRGTDCSDARNASQADVSLAPLGAAIAANAPQSETIVDIPIDQLRGGNYSVAIANATQRAQFAQACARLRHQ
jgi:hypothetical protein